MTGMFDLAQLVIPKTIRLDVHWQHFSSIDPAFEIHVDATFFNAALLNCLMIGSQVETFSVDHLSKSSP